MTDLEGEGLLALWNGVEEARRREYEAWHAREHVPERIAVPGMLGARRYVRLDGPLPDYLTLYAMRDTGVLSSPAYRALLDNPTPWSRSMRPSFRGFMRLCCRREYTAGGGLGGLLAAMTFGEATAADVAALRDTAAGLVGHPGVGVAHLLLRDPSVADVPFTIGGPAPAFPRGGALLVEGYDRGLLDQALAEVASPWASLAPEAPATLTVYALASALSAAALDRFVTLGPDGLGS